MVKGSKIVSFLKLVFDGDVINPLLPIEKAVAVRLLTNLGALLLKQCKQGGEVATNRVVVTKRATAEQPPLVRSIAIQIEPDRLIHRDGLIVFGHGLVAFPSFAPDIPLSQNGVGDWLQS